MYYFKSIICLPRDLLITKRLLFCQEGVLLFSEKASHDPVVCEEIQ